MTDQNKKKVLKIKTTETKKNTSIKTLKSGVKQKAVKKNLIRKTGNNTVTKTVIAVSRIKSDTKNNPTSIRKKPISKKENIPEKLEVEQDVSLAIARGDHPMTIVEHLDELRSRLIIILASFFIFTCVAFYFSDYLVHFINKPFLETGNKLNVFTLAGGFMVKMKVSAAIAVLTVIPLILFHIWRFISPAIEKPERFFSRLTITSAILLFYAGVCFVFLLLPSTTKILLSFINNSMLTTIGADDFLHFIFFMSFIMGFLCELPIAILVLTKIGLVTPQFLIKKRKYAFIIIWIVASIVTPGPDILSQSLVGVPLMFLYEISIVMSKIVLIRKKRKELKLSYRG